MGQYFQRRQQVYLPLKEIHIELHWRDQTCKAIMTFDDVQDLAHFLADNVELGKGVKYVPKRSGTHKMEMPDRYCDLSPTDQKLWLFRAKDVITSDRGVATFDGHNFDDYRLLEKYLEFCCLLRKKN